MGRGRKRPSDQRNQKKKFAKTGNERGEGQWWRFDVPNDDYRK